MFFNNSANLILVATFLGTTGLAQASHWIDCKVKVTVKEIENINRLNGTSVYFNSELADPDHEQVMTFNIDEVVEITGRTPGCFRGDSAKVLIAKDHVGHYQVGDELKMIYRNVGDRPGHSISWYVSSDTVDRGSQR